MTRLIYAYYSFSNAVSTFNLIDYSQQKETLNYKKEKLHHYYSMRTNIVFLLMYFILSFVIICVYELMY